MNENLSPTIAHLRSFKSRPRSEYLPNGNRNAKLTKPLAERFCDLLAESDKSVPHILRENPDLPPFKILFNWQQRVPWFRDMWKQARLRQTHFLADRCFDLYNDAQPKTAHVIRIKFDILKWLAAKFNPADYGDKPLPSQGTTVNVGISISPERLNDLRGKLEHSRPAPQRKLTPVDRPSQLENTSCTSIPEKHARHSNGERVSHTPIRDTKHSATDMQSVDIPKT